MNLEWSLVLVGSLVCVSATFITPTTSDLLYGDEIVVGPVGTSKIAVRLRKDFCKGGFMVVNETCIISYLIENFSSQVIEDVELMDNTFEVKMLDSKSDVMPVRFPSLQPNETKRIDLGLIPRKVGVLTDHPAILRFRIPSEGPAKIITKFSPKRGIIQIVTAEQYAIYYQSHFQQWFLLTLYILPILSYPIFMYYRTREALQATRSKFK